MIARTREKDLVVRIKVVKTLAMKGEVKTGEQICSTIYQELYRARSRGAAARRYVKQERFSVYPCTSQERCSELRRQTNLRI